MNVGELKELLDDFGDHVEVRLVYDTGKVDHVFSIEDIDLRHGDVVIELVKAG